jgi:hypothetical protein
VRVGAGCRAVADGACKHGFTYAQQRPLLSAGADQLQGARRELSSSPYSPTHRDAVVVVAMLMSLSRLRRRAGRW